MPVTANIRRLPQADVRPIGGGKYRVDKRYVYERTVHIEVPEGFECDLASMPLGIGKGGLEEAAALLHDYEYSRAGLPGTRSRIEIDLDWYWNVLWAGRSKAYAWVVFRGVRWFGWIAWRRHKRRNLKKAKDAA